MPFPSSSSTSSSTSSPSARFAMMTKSSSSASSSDPPWDTSLSSSNLATSGSTAFSTRLTGAVFAATLHIVLPSSKSSSLGPTHTLLASYALTSRGSGSGPAVELGTKEEAAAAEGRSSRRWER
uniref:Uncharacterized protein n=1 Tax=Arundo donax TaxID=35708 RepID=A0A0A9EA40_ARUDO